MPQHPRLVGSIATSILLAAAVACGGSSSPAGPDTPPVTTPPVTLAACATWAATQTGSGISATGDVVSQRAALLAAGGGVKAVGSKYYAMWFPSNWATSSPRRVMVSLHGTGGAPETEWSIDWKDIVSQRGWAFIGLKYVNDATGVHDDETTIYANIKTLLTDVAAACDFGSPSMFLVGFSRGSAESFPIAYLDLKDRRYFKAVGNNSGAWVIGEPLTPTMAAIVDRKETNAYVGTKFWMYCGALDNGHGYPMCDEMKNAQSFIQSYGGTVERLYQDPAGGHGGLAKNSDAWLAMFTYFEGLK
jgi:hypothetical protein